MRKVKRENPKKKKKKESKKEERNKMKEKNLERSNLRGFSTFHISGLNQTLFLFSQQLKQRLVPTKASCQHDTLLSFKYLSLLIITTLSLFKTEQKKKKEKGF